MTRSNPPSSNTEPGGRSDDQAPDAIRPSPPARRLVLRLAGPVRWLHIYLSMFGLATVLFFSLTGITLNHPRWFYDGVAASVEAEGRLDPALIRGEVNKLEVVEHLRREHGLRGALASFTTEEEECVVTFKGPGYSADAFIRRPVGAYRVTENRQGLVAVINDLHKGRETGPVWSAVVDASAILMALAAATGLVLLFYIKRRRAVGLLTALAGAIALAAAFLLGVR
jgi:hypothetical protein